MKKLFVLFGFCCVSFFIRAQSDYCFHSDSLVVINDNLEIESFKKGDEYYFRVLSEGKTHSNYSLINIMIDSYKIQESERWFLLSYPVFGSTYGAENYVVVWNDGWGWQSSILPFNRVVLSGSNKSDFIVYQGENILYYNFERGLLIEIR